MKNFNTGPAPKTLTETIELGYEYDEVVTDAGTELVYRLDSDGSPITAKYVVPTAMSTSDLAGLVKVLGDQDTMLAKMEADQFGTFVEIAGAIYGDKFVIDLFRNKSVKPPVFMAFVTWGLEQLGFGDLLPEGTETDNPLASGSPGSH